MLKFFDDYAKINPEPEVAKPTPIPEDTPNMTPDDMKNYFEAMKESLMSEIREQLKQTSTPSVEQNNVTADNDIINNEQGGNDNASNTNL